MINSKINILNFNPRNCFNTKPLIKKIFKDFSKSSNFNINNTTNFPHKFLKSQKFFSEKNESKEKNDNNTKEDFISFGYKNVKKDDRQDMVNSVFANVAKR